MNCHQDPVSSDLPNCRQDVDHRDLTDQTALDRLADDGCPRFPPAGESSPTEEELEDCLRGKLPRLFAILYQCAGSYGLGEDDIEEGVQDGLLAAVELLRAGDAAHMPHRWPRLIVTARNRACWHARRRRRLQSFAPIDQADDTVRHRIHRAEDTRQTLLNAIASAINMLSRRDRVLLGLCVIEGWSHARAAHWCGVHPGTINRWLSEARRNLRESATQVLLLHGFDPSELPG